jgi:hypothetical protein
LESLLLPTPNSVGSIAAKVGIVDLKDDKIICFRTKNAGLAAKTAVSVIAALDATPQKILEATIEKKLKKSCVGNDSEAGDDNPEQYSYYSLVLNDKKADKSDVAISIGVVAPLKQTQIQDNLARVDLDGDDKPEYFRLCASNEGLHLTIWSGKPLTGTRIWHYYYYLNYDTEADCEEKDWEGTED